MAEEKKEVDWMEVGKDAFVGDVLDFLLDVTPLGKPVGDFVDIAYTLPKLRKNLPEADRDITYLFAFAEAVPFVELLPNWVLLAAGSYVREKTFGEKGPGELLGLKGGGSKSSATGEKRTFFEELGLPAPEEVLGTGLKSGTARIGEERGRGVPLTEEERGARHKTIFGELGLPTPDELLAPFKKKEEKK